MRCSGVLMPITSLPSKYGIGCFSKEAYNFIDSLKAAGQSYWQILPIGPTGYGDSPYQSFSAFAGNPYFIDLEDLIDKGLLSKKECDDCDFGDDRRSVDYDKLYKSRYGLLWIAFGRFDSNDEEYIDFKKENQSWLDDYAEYMAIKDSKDGVSWDKWEDDIRLREESALKEYREALAEDIEFYKFLQYMFFGQWNKLKKYAGDREVGIIGDIPIYVAYDSSDCWSHREMFMFDNKGYPKCVAGCPPDAFSKTGQLWGNPIYDWKKQKKNGYKWWIERVKYNLSLYDVVRIDHFRGFDEYYTIPYGNKTAKYGKWEKGPGIELFDKIKESLGDVNIIAEDLGYLTESVKQMLKESGFPGMKLIQFAFDSRESGNYLPYTYEKNSVVYTGTHDNNTLRGWYEELAYSDKEYAMKYLNKRSISNRSASYDFIKVALSAVSDLAIIPIQDYLNMGGEARINTPSVLGGNWTWRMTEGDLNKKVIEKMRELAVLYHRTGEE